MLTFLNEFAGDPLVEKVEATLIQFIDSKRYLPSEGDIQDRGLQRYWWIIHNHSLLLYINPPDAYVLGIIDGEVRGREGIEHYLVKLASNL